MRDPTISVLIPAHDAEATLGAALRSVQRQTFRDIEILVVDDGSADGTAELVRTWSTRDARLRLLRGAHLGVAGALNRGLKAARAPWVARLDADDAMHPRRLATQMEVMMGLSQPRATILGTGIRMVPSSARTRGNLAYETWLNSMITPADHLRGLFLDSPVAHPSFFASRSLYETLGGYRAGPFPEDYDLLLRAVTRGIELRKVPAVLTYWRDHARRLTRTSKGCSRESIRALKARHLACWRRSGSLGGDRPLWIWGAGPYGRRLAGALEREGIEVAAFVDIDPQKIGRKLRKGRALVVGPEALSDAEPRPYLLLAVATPGARSAIEAHLRAKGWRDLADFRAIQ